jgi:hypothetical protein
VRFRRPPPRATVRLRDVDDAEHWRERQMVNVVLTWAVPVASFFFTLLMIQLSLRSVAAVSAICAALSALVAPGLTLVFLLRFARARELAQRTSSLPVATARRAAPRPTGTAGDRTSAGGADRGADRGADPRAAAP